MVTKLVTRTAASELAFFNRAATSDNPPRWLSGISDDGLIWTVSGGFRVHSDKSVISFDIVLPDGTHLSEPSNRALLDLAMAYAARYRVVNPEATSATHQARVRDLLIFLCWMNLHNVPDLSRITPDHIELFVSKIAYGSELALEIPQRLIRQIARAMKTGKSPELMPRHIHKIAREPIYDAIHAARRGVAPYRLGRAVLDWFDSKQWTADEWSDVDLVMKKAGVRPSLVTWASISRALKPLEEMYLWQKFLPGESFSFPPFPKGASSAAQASGIETERTPIIPPKHAFKFLSLATKWVLDVAPIVKELREGKLTNIQAQNHLKELDIHLTIKESSWLKISTERRTVSPEGLERLLASACFAVIAGLTARRHNEITDLAAGCVAMDSEGHYWITIYIEKTLRRYDVLPIAAIVQKAVLCMEEISSKAREKSATDSLWQTIRGDSVVPLKGAAFLNELAQLGGTLSDEGGSAWNFTPHQFRRFFALIYFWRYDRGGLGALSHHLRHFDLEMTRRYVTDVEGKRIFAEIAGVYRADLLRSFVSGGKAIGGLAGNHIKKAAHKAIEHYRAVVDVVMPDKVVAKLNRTAERLGIDFVQHVWGTICACPSKTKFAAQAKCKGDRALGPVFRNATVHHCANCAFAIHTEQFAAAAKGAISACTSTSTEKGTLLADLSKIHISSLEEALKRADPSPLTVDGVYV